MAPIPQSGHPAVEAYLAEGYERVVGMSSRFAAAICARLLRLQTEEGVSGPIAEIGAFEGRFFIALAHALEPGEIALGIDIFEWPNPEVRDRFEANCLKHGIAAERRVTIKADAGAMSPAELIGHARGSKLRFIHIDGEHSRAALGKDLALATACLAEGGLIVLDDMLHPGYPTLMVAVQDYLSANPDIVPLCIIDRETIVGATKFVLCQRDWFERYQAAMLTIFAKQIWPLGADFEPHWCLVLSLDTRLAEIT
ncbi:Methyltransferase domain-containing protein [Bosea sp. 62]|uniref:class I SAM-dependent methyltransferase n=1 Tax=unclassified Bosea (in: a-proteobacteria) TaxID=2653178 RepID=UPI001250D28F|nr:MULTISPECIES: class I SAM-dependent methyltransferase [unclassified Bosea (in: a-proteobacteria)]CAD5292125.1 Methyltransferase domain-containing protein [Bosea sp. 7B]CAD5299316.1 Methyltransferase domain-containing protein [Bosea sp. 21B]CAD5299443.1 Methyltransferase domain-containing protein [Bosea sp. 46]VVT61657.1 Methyltransferase domain-containing protein [Bosea sp. EC-HK365B]VXB06579.1 Methyltransferase domain-containing protein [Bosea sp. 127]